MNIDTSPKKIFRNEPQVYSHSGTKSSIFTHLFESMKDGDEFLKVYSEFRPNATLKIYRPGQGSGLSGPRAAPGPSNFESAQVTRLPCDVPIPGDTRSTLSMRPVSMGRNEELLKSFILKSVY
ncbi:hypothetical protein TNCV_679361 [Trichonephila clavipes]|nr:hypothetical protein TNCV_679361 [Trichonephila clavipes]